MPILTVGDRNQDVWLAAVLATLMGTLNAFFLSRLAALFPGQTVMQFCASLGSAITAKIIGAPFVVFAVFVTTVTFRDFAELMVTVFFPETPMLVFLIIIALLAAWASLLGFEVIARMTQFLLPLILAGILAGGLMALKGADWQNLLPVVENGLAPIIRGGITQWAFFGDMAIWFVLLPHLHQRDKNYRFMPLSIIIAGFVLVAALIFVISVFGPYQAVMRTYPYLSLIKSISIAEFLERAEGGFLIIWVASNFIKIVVFFYTAVFGVSQYFRQVKRGFIILPMMVVSVGLSILLFPGYQDLRHFFRPEIYAVLSSLIQIIIPAIVAGLWLIKTKTGKVKPAD